MKQNLPLKIVVSTLGVLGASLHLWKPDLQIDSTTIVLFVIALLPWLQPLIKSVEGLGIKVEMQELLNKLDAVQNETKELASVAVGGKPPVASRAPVSSPELSAEELNTLRRLAWKGQFRFRRLEDLARELSMQPEQLAPILAALHDHRLVSPLGKDEETRDAISQRGRPDSIWHIPSAETLAKSGIRFPI